jgi:hypothetical protein
LPLSYAAALAIAVANDERSQARAEAKQHESVLVIGVVGVVDEQRSVVQENGLRFLE